MNYKIEIRPFAAMEVLEAFDWYELQQEGLGMDFLNELDNFYNILQRNPATFSFYDKPVREGKINRFPYTVVYEVVDERIVVYSVFMYKQNPNKKRIF